jgi:putative spermidine/putrescine transport system ATP-binding protein
MAGLGVVQVGVGFLAFAVAARLLPAAELGLITLLEVVLGPAWVWITFGEQPARATFVGGALVLGAVLLQAMPRDGWLLSTIAVPSPLGDQPPLRREMPRMMSTTDPAAGAALDLRGLVKRYGADAAVDDVSLNVPAGAFVTLLGPSGSGKTTTLNMIAGFVEVDEGDIQMDGRPIADLPSHKRDIGVVFQHYALFPHMTVRDNLAFPLKRRKVPGVEQAELIRAALEMVRLDGYGDRYPNQLSGGQQQRVALARALVFSPRVLLMDEPLGALDKKLREWLQLELKRIHSELGITFVYVTHDQEEALVLSDRIAVFNNGKIEQVGTAEQLYEEPSTLFVAEFLGESNVFTGRVRRDGTSCELRMDEGYALAAPATDARDGSPAAIVVRPERVVARRPGTPSAGGENVLAGRLRQIIYLGSYRRLDVTLSGGRQVQLREPAGSGLGLAPGDALEVCWRADDATLVCEVPDGRAGDAGETAPSAIAKTSPVA